jgi:hypothetical protein
VKNAPEFDLISAKLEELTSFNSLEARGTLRIALKESGLEVKNLRADQLKVVIERILPRHLLDRGIEDPEEICRLLIAAIPRGSSGSAAAESDSPEAIFERLGSR